MILCLMTILYNIVFIVLFIIVPYHKTLYVTCNSYYDMREDVNVNRAK